MYHYVCLCVYLRLTSIFYFQYMIWRVMTGRNSSITISFLPAGHTKFSPDTCLKQKYRKKRYWFIRWLCNCRRKISICQWIPASRKYQWWSHSTNIWLEELFCSVLHKIDRIKVYFHFKFDAQWPGVVFLRETYSSCFLYSYSIIFDSLLSCCLWKKVL